MRVCVCFFLGGGGTSAVRERGNTTYHGFIVKRKPFQLSQGIGGIDNIFEHNPCLSPHRGRFKGNYVEQGTILREEVEKASP